MTVESPTARPVDTRSTFSSLRAHRNYRLYFVGQIVSELGTGMQEAALPWLVFERTHSPVLVGLLVFCRFGPFSLLAPHGGVLADRFDNRRMFIATQAADMVIAALLAIAAFSHVAPLWTIFLLASGSGVVLAFDTPNKYALIYRLVARNEVPNAVALSYTLPNIGRILGPAIGGVLIAAFGVGWCFLINAASFVGVLVAVLLMRVAELFPIERDNQRGYDRKALREGLLYAWRTRHVLTLMGLVLVGGLLGFSAMRTLLPVLAASTLHGGPRLFGGLYACYGLGAVLGGLLNARYGTISWRRLIAGALSFNLGILILASIRTDVLAAIILMIIGGSWITWSSQAQTSIQLMTPDALRGRVISLYVTAQLAGAPLGGLIAGWLAAAGGTTVAFAVAGGAGVLACALAVLYRQSADTPKPSTLGAS